jgi:cytochrome c
MKKVLVILMLGSFVIGCVNDEKAKAKLEQAAPPEEKVNPAVAEGLDLIAKSDCLTCHKLNEAGVGPAYEAVAAKYSNEPSVIDTLAGKIISGGAGNWGSVPMTPHPTLAKEDAKKMVQYILSLKK